MTRSTILKLSARIYSLILTLNAGCALAQTPAADEAVLRGLAPVASLYKTEAGRAALSANLTVTGGIQTGSVTQTTLTSLEEERLQSLRDASSTTGNAAQLADGLGTALGAAYVARAHYTDATHFTNATQGIADLLAFSMRIAGGHSQLGKYFFANGTTEGKTPVSTEEKAILDATGGTTDPFGKAYHLPAGSPNGDRYGDARPYQTEAEFHRFVGRDYYNLLTDNTAYTRGPVQDLTDSPSYPSGHTTYGYTESLVLGLLVPERYPQMIVRGAEYGNSRIVVGAHYAMDVLGGRTLALYDMAHLLSKDSAYPAFLTQANDAGQVITDFPTGVRQARADLTHILEAACGKPVAQCALDDISRFSDTGAEAAFYASTQTYGLPVVHPDTAGKLEDVNVIAPEAGYLLTVAYPQLTLQQANTILTQTEGPGGGFLDDGSGFGVYSRLNLYAATQEAARQSKSAAQ